MYNDSTFANFPLSEGYIPRPLDEAPIKQGMGESDLGRWLCGLQYGNYFMVCNTRSNVNNSLPWLQKSSDKLQLSFKTCWKAELFYNEQIEFVEMSEGLKIINKGERLCSIVNGTLLVSVGLVMDSGGIEN